ncbi:MAG: hypothetical protein AAF394_17375, partial [Planctomycetota bacterium]
ELAGGNAGELQLTSSGQSYWRANLNVDVVEYCLQRKIPIAKLEKNRSFHMGAWKTAAAENHARSADPVLVSQDERFAETLKDAVHSEAHEESFQKEAFRHETMNRLFRGWLDEKIEKLNADGIPSMVESVDVLTSGTTGETFAEHPDALKKINSIDLAISLQKNLQFGVLDEYGWPAFEAAYQDLNTEKEPPNVAPQYPWVLIYNSSRVVAVDYQGVVAEHELRLPKDHQVADVLYVPDQFAISSRNHRTWQADGYYWSSNPKQRYDKDCFIRSRHAVLARHGDAWMTHGGCVRAGQHPVPRLDELWTESGRFWATRSVGDYEQDLHEIDPTGEKKPRRSAPPFFTDKMPTGAIVSVSNSFLVELPEGLASSPLGSRDGMSGWVHWWIKDKDKSLAIGIDGRKPEKDTEGLDSLMDQPEGDGYWYVADDGGSYYEGMSLKNSSDVDMSENEAEYRAGQCASLPVMFLNFYKVRDEAFSKKLRSVSLEDCQKLLEAAIVDENQSITLQEQATSRDEETSVEIETRKQIKALFGEGNELLVKGLASIVRVAGSAARQHQNMAKTHDPAEAKRIKEMSEADLHLKRWLKAVGARNLSYYYGDWDTEHSPAALKKKILFLQETLFPTKMA